MRYSIFDFSRLKQLFHNLTAHLINVEAGNNRKAENNTGNPVVGDHNTQVIINLQMSEDEEEKINLSEVEQEILERLARGGYIVYVRDGKGNFCDAKLLGNNGNPELKSDLIGLLPDLLMKGLIEHEGKNHYVISPSGKRIIQWLFFNKK